MRRIPQKTEGSTAGRLPMVFEQKVINMLYKTESNETQQKQNIIQSPSKKWAFKSHDVPMAQGLQCLREDQASIKDAKAY